MTERLSCVDIKHISSSKKNSKKPLNYVKSFSGCKNDLTNIVICPYNCRTCTFAKGRNKAFPPISQNFIVWDNSKLKSRTPLR